MARICANEGGGGFGSGELVNREWGECGRMGKGVVLALGKWGNREWREFARMREGWFWLRGIGEPRMGRIYANGEGVVWV